MIRKLLFVAAAALVMSISWSATAQKGGYESKRYINIDDEDVILGTVQRPDGGWISDNLKPIFSTLIEPRYNFVPEMISSADGI